MRNASFVIFAAALLILTAPIGSGEASAEGLEPIEYTLGDGTVIRFSGQINMGVLHYDDGQDDFTNFVDNDNSSSRARLQILNDNGDGSSNPHLKPNTSPSRPTLSANWTTRPTGTFLRPTFARRRWLSQMSASESSGSVRAAWRATDSAEVDNSGTAVIAYSSIA